MKTYNDLQKLGTTLLKSILNAYSADYGRLLSTSELIEREKTIALIQVELRSRKKTDTDVNAIIWISMHRNLNKNRVYEDKNPAE